MPWHKSGTNFAATRYVSPFTMRPRSVFYVLTCKQNSALNTHRMLLLTPAKAVCQ